MPLRRSGHPPAVSPQAVGSYVLGDLLHRAAAYLGHTQVSKAVIAVPAKFDARQRAATVEAFGLAGLKVCPRCPAEQGFDRLISNHSSSAYPDLQPHLFERTAVATERILCGQRANASDARKSRFLPAGHPHA